jgi:hypothetical protein
MKTQKISFSNIKDVLSRDEMKNIMAGSGSYPTCLTRRYGFYESGLCSGPSVSACEQYCLNAGYYCECGY